MTVVAAVFTPLVLAYQGWSYYVFRARVARRPRPHPPRPPRRLRRHLHRRAAELGPCLVAPSRSGRRRN